MSTVGARQLAERWGERMQRGWGEGYEQVKANESLKWPLLKNPKWFNAALMRTSEPVRSISKIRMTIVMTKPKREK
jgi:hypothetical protein